MLKLSIPKPCHEDWAAMTPNQLGRHCAVCAKTVTDFTQMSDDEVKFFFLNKKQDERTCGRFTNKQLNQITIELPANIYYITMPLWKKFLAACLIIFGATLFSCETSLQGKPQIENNLTGVNEMPQQITLLGDTSIQVPKMGEPIAIDTTVKNICNNTKTVTEEAIVKGEIAIPTEAILQGAVAEDLPIIDRNDIDKIKPVKDTTKLKDTANCSTQKFY